MKSSTAFFTLALLAAATLRAEDPKTFEVSSFRFTRPADWKWVEVSSPMRKAQLAVPGKDAAKPAEITFFHFGAGGAGGVDANVKRWLGQFQSKEGADKVEPETLGGVKVIFVSTEGTFSSGMPGAPAKPMENYALLGAILDHADGPVFVKMTGPAETVRDAAKHFRAFIAEAAGAKS
jgi:hypothetical protein